jgi:peroxin-12
MNSANQEKLLYNLTPGQRSSSLMLLTLVPYLRAKLDAFYLEAMARTTTAAARNNNNISDSTTSRSSSTSPATAGSGTTPSQSSSTEQQQREHIDYQRKAMEIFQTVYPFLSSAHEAARFWYQLLYLLNKTPYFSPELHLLGLVVARVSGQDVSMAERRKEMRHNERLQWARRGRGGPIFRLVRESWVQVSSAAGTHTRSALILAVFGYKLLEWWYTSAEQKLGGQEAPPPPPPPPAPKPSPQGVRLPNDPGICPLCRAKRVNPAMIATSGYVFCYPCAFKFVESEGFCPVTKIPARVSQIRRLYLGGS